MRFLGYVTVMTQSIVTNSLLVIVRILRSYPIPKVSEIIAKLVIHATNINYA
jgi:hypothetical protein